jgi:hypothetical protein
VIHVIHLLVSRIELIMFSWRMFWSWLNKKKQPKNDTAQRKILYNVIHKCPVGALIQVKFVHPNDTGLSDPGNKMPKRYDADDFKTRTLKGTLLSKKNMLGLDYIEMCVVKVGTALGHYERTYTIMLEEIEDFRILAT